MSICYWYIGIFVYWLKCVKHLELGTWNFFIFSHSLIHGAKAPAPELLGTGNLELETHIPAPSFLLPFPHPLINHFLQFNNLRTVSPHMRRGVFEFFNKRMVFQKFRNTFCQNSFSETMINNYFFQSRKGCII